MKHWILALALALVTLLGACAQPPKKALADAEQALREAAVVSECAQEEFKAAEERLARARRLVEEGDYDAAEVQAKAARQLAIQAKKKGELSWEECQKEKNKANAAVEQEAEPQDLTPDPSQLQTVYFDYNEATLSDKAQGALKANAEWMRRYTGAQVTIQGHCDERGSTEYNVALGERRGHAARNYLIQLGIDGARMSVVSFGEEMPAVVGQGEDGHARNRRAEFVMRKAP
jgi:peptidoglycan-associated lipoprotein